MLILGAETPATTEIEAPVIERHLNVHTSMSATVADVEDLIDDPTATAHVFKGHNESIFHLEALCVCAAFPHTIALAPAGTWNVVFTDNINTVQMFNSLTALPSLLMVVVDAVLAKDTDFRVLHVPGVHNATADVLSRSRKLEAVSLEPPLSI